jgi:hypothetical protein
MGEAKCAESLSVQPGTWSEIQAASLHKRAEVSTPWLGPTGDDSQQRTAMHTASAVFVVSVLSQSYKYSR